LKDWVRISGLLIDRKVVKTKFNADGSSRLSKAADRAPGGIPAHRTSRLRALVDLVQYRPGDGLDFAAALRHAAMMERIKLAAARQKE
jgi:hypothetical protein